MIIEGVNLNKREKASFALRGLYANSGFELFRMSKFEAFELYAENRDFMDAASIITFTDTDGMLMALKPDVTLSIVKNNRNIGGGIRRIYYNENVYRVSPRTGFFKEMMQTGLECLGQIDNECLRQVLTLAARSLKVLSDSVKLDISNMDIPEQIIRDNDIPADTAKAIAKCLSEKNGHSLERICSENDISEEAGTLFKTLITTYGKPEEILPKLRRVFKNAKNTEAYLRSLDKLDEILKSFKGTEFEQMIEIDFSVVSDLKYYNGIVFKGFIEGLADSILSGGQYDKLMKKMERNSGAVGFAVYLDDLDMIDRFDGEEIEIHG